VSIKKNEVSDGDLIWIPPNTLHEMTGYPPFMDVPYVHFDLCFDLKRSLWQAYIPIGTGTLKKYRQFIHPPIRHPIIKKLFGKLNIPNKFIVGDLIKKLAIVYNSDGHYYTPEPLGPGCEPYPAMYGKPDFKLLDKLVADIVSYFGDRENTLLCF